MIDLQGFGDQIAAGAMTTLRVAATSLVLGIGVGFAGALAKLSRSPVLRWLAGAYTTTIRGVPESGGAKVGHGSGGIMLLRAE